MARKIIDIGVVGNDGTGDSIRDSFRKVNDNFRELYSSLGLGEKLTFVGLDDTPDSYVGQNDPATGSTPILTVNNTESGITFKQLVPGVGMTIDFISNPDQITLNAVFSEVSADPSPQLGGDLSVTSGGNQYRIRDLTTPVYIDEAINKQYADTKLSKAGVNAIDPSTGLATTSFGRMTGPLVLSRDPQPDDDVLYDGLTAATKRYVDNSSFGSSVNLYVATSGQDERVGVSKALQGRALAYAYRTLEAALKRAEELVLEARQEIGPYKKVLTYNGGLGTCTLSEISTSPSSGAGFAGALRMSVDTVTINGVGTNYFPGDILTISGGTIPLGGGAATIEVLTTATTPGAIVTFRIISTGAYTALPGSSAIATTITTSAAPPGVGAIGAGATFNITYKVSSVSITSGGSGYSLVSVRISGGGGSGGFGTASVVGGSVTGITITDTGGGFTSLPTLSVDLPRFAIKTEGFRTDFTGDVLTDTPEAIRGRDIREGLYLRGETSGALAQILAHDGDLDSNGNELFDLDIKYGNFQINEVISYGDVTKNIQITVLVESGIYEENYPLKVPQNVSIVGDEFRRCIIRPRPGTSSSPWAFQKFRRDLTIDGLTTADRLYGYHYLQDSSQPVYPKVDNKGAYTSAAALVDLNKQFVQEEIIAWMDYNITNNVAPFTSAFTYNSSLCKRDVGLLVDAIVFDLKWGDYNRTISAGLKYYQSASALVAITTQLSQYLAVMDRINVLLQSIILNSEIVSPSQDSFIQIVDLAYAAESGSGAVITALIAALKDVIDGSGSVNYPKENDQMDVFLANDAVRWQAITGQGHGGFMGILDPQGQILAKSPYFQECASFSKSIDAQTFAGGMFVDGFSGNLQFYHTASASTTRLSVSNLDRFPQLPASFLVDDTVYRVNYVRDYVYSPSGSTATFVLDETTPFTRSAGSQTCVISAATTVAVITRNDHRMQAGATVVFTTTGTLPTGITAGREYYVLDDGLTNNSFNITATFGSITKVTISDLGTGTHSYQRVYELLMPGNRSMLANDYTQINDMGYGALAMNGGLMELVSMFTYYCYISYYSVNGGQIRSVGGSSAHGVYALVAQGSDPLEIPTPTTIHEEFAQSVKCYYPSPSYANTAGGLFIYVYAYDYVPLNASELEIDHGNVIYRYSVTSVTTQDLPTGVARINLSSGTGAETTGLYDVVAADTKMTMRNNGQVLLTGDLVNVAVRPSTGLKLRETGDTVYRVLQFSSYADINGPYEVSISNASPAVIKVLLTITDISDNLCTTSQNHKLKTGDVIIPTSTANGFTSGTTYYVTDVPEYNQFYVSTSPSGTVSTLVNGSGLTVKAVKSHKMLENYTLSFETTGTLPSPLVAGQVYFVIPDGLTTTEFQLSDTKNGTPIDTTTAGSGTHSYNMEGLTRTNLRENYNYIDLTIWQPSEFSNYSLTATNTATSTNLITLSTISYQVKPGMKIIFSGTTFGNIVAGTTYYVKTSPYSASIPVATVERSGTTATIVTSVNHGLASGQTVDINSTGTALDSDDAVVITVTNATTFTYTSGASGLISSTPATTGRVVPDSKITITDSAGGSTFALATASGTMTAVAGDGVTCTVSVASPAVITANGHGFAAGDCVVFQTTGSLPTGLTDTINYFVLSTGLGANSFRVSAEPGGTAVDTSGSQSGVHTVGRAFGRVGDQILPVVPVGTNEISRCDGAKFVWKGEEYVISDYQQESVTNEPYARLVLDRPLVDSIIDYSSAYTIKAAVPIRTNGSIGNLTIRISLTRVTSHDLLEIGTGSYADTNYPSEIYGSSVNPINEDTETEERDVGRVFFVTTDQYGNFKVGPYFKVDQGTGTVTFSSSIALSNLDGIGFKRGVPVSEFSTDSGFTDNATDTVPTENATRIYIERRLGITHDGSPVASGSLIPSVIGGYMSLDGQLAMKANMNMGNFRITNLADPTNPQDAATLRSLTFTNFSEFNIVDPKAADLLVFTGEQRNTENATVVGDVALAFDSTLNTIDAQIQPGVILNADINASAGIEQSKLSMTAASTRASAAGITQADRGLASFNSTEFTASDGWISLATNGTVITKLEQIATKTVLGNSGLSTANVAAVAFSTVVSDGGAIKKTQYSSTGFLRRTSSVSSSSDGDYTIVEAAAGTSASPEASKLVIRDSSGDFGARIVDLSQLKMDTQVAIDSAATATGGYLRYYGYNTAGGILIQSGSLAADKKTAYWNDAHNFKTQDGLSDAPITASSIQVQAITTGGNTTAGTITGRWTLTGTSPNESRLQATYSADLAEYYEGDKEYEVGTVLVFGGDKEVTVEGKYANTRVAGVVSNTAAFVMYDACPGHKNLVALQGRVPVKVVGKIEKGDLLVTSKTPGVAISAGEDARTGTVIGKALERYDSDHIGTIEVAVGRS